LRTETRTVGNGATLEHAAELAKRPGVEHMSKHPTDVYVGSRIRARRQILGLAPEKLGEVLGINFQQIHKCESGSVSVSASRLHSIADALGVGVAYFFPKERGAERRLAPSVGVPLPEGPLSPSDSAGLLRALEMIGDTELRDRLLALIHRIARIELP